MSRVERPSKQPREHALHDLGFGRLDDEVAPGDGLRRGDATRSNGTTLAAGRAEPLLLLPAPLG